ncbi:MAG: hypothetical protein GXO24_07215 [Chlorobi bacterium]|nr:hypothetical protein [Chlorobiota bacterium]
MDDYSLSPEVVFKLKSPSKVTTLITLTHDIVENTNHDYFIDMAGILNRMIIIDLGGSKGLISKKKADKITQSLVNAITGKKGVPIEELVKDEMQVNERLTTGLSLLLNLPAFSTHVPNSEEEYPDFISNQAKFYAAIFIFDDLYGTKLSDFFDLLYNPFFRDIPPAYFKDNVVPLLARKPDLFKE